MQKLFKVLVPRFDNTTESYTSQYMLPVIYPENRRRAVLELKGKYMQSLSIICKDMTLLSFIGIDNMWSCPLVSWGRQLYKCYDYLFCI